MESSDEKAIGVHANSICSHALIQGSQGISVGPWFPMWPFLGKGYLREISNSVDKYHFYCYFINKEPDFMYQHLMMLVIKIFHLQVYLFHRQMMRWSFWTQPETKGQILNLGEHMQIMPDRGVSSFNHSATQLIHYTLCWAYVKHHLGRQTLNLFVFPFELSEDTI